MLERVQGIRVEISRDLDGSPVPEPLSTPVVVFLKRPNGLCGNFVKRLVDPVPKHHEGPSDVPLPLEKIRIVTLRVF